MTVSGGPAAGAALGPARYSCTAGREGTSVRLAVQVALGAYADGDADRIALDRASYDAARERLAAGAPLAVACSFDGPVEVTPEDRAQAVAFVTGAVAYLDALAAGPAATPAVPAALVLGRVVAVPAGAFARPVSLSLACGNAVTALPENAFAEAAASDGARVVTAADGRVWVVRAPSYDLSAARVYVLAPLSTVPVSLDVTVAGRTVSYSDVDLDTFAVRALAALESVDTPGLARTRTRLAAAMARGLRLAAGDEPDTAGWAEARAVVRERLLARLTDVPEAVVQHDLAAPAELPMLVEGPRTHALAPGARRLTYVGAARTPLASRVAAVAFDGAWLPLDDGPAATADVPVALPLRALPVPPGTPGTEALPRPAPVEGADAAEAIAEATQWALRVSWRTVLAPEDRLDVTLVPVPVPLPLAAPGPAGDLPDRLARIVTVIPDVLPGGVPAPGAAATLTELADGLDEAWAAWVDRPPLPLPLPAPVTVTEDVLDGAVRVTVAYELPEAATPRVLIEGCDATEAEPPEGAGERPRVAWTYRDADGRPPLPDATRTLEVAWLEAARQPRVASSLRVVRNAAAPPAFGYATSVVTYEPVGPVIDTALDVDVAPLAGAGATLAAHVAALVAAVTREGASLDAAVAVTCAVGPATIPVTVLPRVELGDELAASLAAHLSAWLADAPPEASALVFDVTLYATDPPARLRGLTLRLADVAREAG
jgi:hypothetical protein